MKKLLVQFARFFLVGVTATLIDFGLLILFTEFFGTHYLVGNTLSFLVATVFNYAVSMLFVFKRKDDISRQKEFLIFLVLSVIGLAINSACMWATVSLLSLDYRIAKLLATVITTAWNFISRKVFLDAQ